MTDMEPMNLTRAGRRVAGFARDNGLEIQVEEFPAGTKTAAQAAEAVGCPVAAIVKSLVFMVDERPVVSLIPGDLRLDEKKLGDAVAGQKVRRAGLDEVRTATGYAAGGTPPFAYDEPIEVLADYQLRRHSPLWAAAGTPSTVFPIGLEDLIRLSGARWADLSR